MFSHRGLSPDQIMEDLFRQVSDHAPIEHLRSGVQPNAQTIAVLEDIKDELEELHDRALATYRGRDASRRIKNALYLCHAALAPIRRLPRELLIVIFEMALPQRWEFAAASLVPEFVNVCHVWREVAIGYPHLWTAFTVHQGTHEDALANRLGWTAGQPLSVCILDWYFYNDKSGRIHPDKNPGSWSEETLRLIFAESYRWRKLDIDLQCIMNALDPYWPETFPMLTDLNLQVNNNLAEAVEFFGEIAPNVTKLESCCEELNPNNPIKIPAAWKLTYLELHPVASAEQYLADLMQTIAQCADTLEYLEVYTHDVGDVVGTYHTITFPKLRKLKLWLDACHLCRYVVAPQIESIILKRDNYGMSGVNKPELTSLHELLRRSAGSDGACSLKHLDLLNLYPVKPQVVLDCLNLVPQLTSLSIRDTSGYCETEYQKEGHKLIISPEFLQAMTRSWDTSDSRNRLLPKLSTLRLIYGYKTEEMQLPALGMLMSRKTIFDSNNTVPLVDCKVTYERDEWYGTRGHSM
ncbi:uncharacterized protein SCHCODRAFT_02695445 [Schizophyllum commune H4-8]|uniref:uncharacterized protein n=1 Tax=Schizophyllum commune (strain H4-8 / FGSC 9210) TaxID=578458 RepID=UPI002160978B|nr:uncharacterized protein SCHCODRAFT_02695445 [Schizophyllum commune H4-8]KAI5900196.1 hypothetical protein SCHCODRAFT_02695445 [Schizophyllum commune H4-8]